MRKWFILLIVLVGVNATGPLAVARVKLTTLPQRDRVVIHLDEGEATLVEEERVVPLNEGVNQVDFSWANTRIDPRTIVFRVVEPMPGQQAGDDQPAQQMSAEVLSVSYPPDEQALIWDVHASAAGAARVRISYLLGGVRESFHYRALADHAEQTLTLEQRLRVSNFAPEGYEEAMMTAGPGRRFQRSIAGGQTKELTVAEYGGVKIEKTYTADLAEHGYLDQQEKKLRVPMHYVLANDSDAGLGNAALPAGKVRIFQKEDPGDAASTVFLGEDRADHTPIDDRMRLFLGLAKDVVVRRRIERRDVDQASGPLKHERVTVRYEIENFKEEPVTLRVVETIDRLRREIPGLDEDHPAEWHIGEGTTFEGEPKAEASGHAQVVFEPKLPAREGDDAETIVRELELVFRNEWDK